MKKADHVIVHEKLSKIQLKDPMKEQPFKALH